MKEKWKTLILSIIICIIGGTIGLLGKYVYHSWKFQKLYDSLLIDGQDEVLFLGRPTCGFCNLFKPILEETSEKYEIEYRYINTDWFTKKELEKVLNKLNIRKSTFSTPRLIITEGTEIKDHYIGYMDDISLFHFFQKNGLIEESEVFIDPYLNIERLTGKAYFSLIEDRASTYILLGRIGDSEVNAILKYASDAKKNMRFLNPSVFVTEEEYLQFQETVKELKAETKMPILLEMKEGKIVSILEDVSKKDIEQIK